LGVAAVLLGAGCERPAPTETQPPPTPQSKSPGPAPAAEAPKDARAARTDEPKKEAEVAKAPTKTPGGVEIEDLVIGTGAECKPHQTITAFYTGTLKSNGKQFETNVGGAPLVYPLDKLVEGWQEGIPGMKVGGKRKLTIPYRLGYGEAGFPPDIPPRADLVFIIELVGVE
jgi:FKBP-type peptidyl-prolyl cis-trans isomerase